MAATKPGTTGVENIYQPGVSKSIWKMDVRDLIRVAAAAGFRGQDLEIAVAIALAESGGIMDAKGDVKLANKTWGPSVGLWQIRTLKAQTGKGTTRDINTLSEAYANAKAAFALYQARKKKGQRGFEDWTTYTGATASGKANRYTKNLQAVRTGMAQVGGERAVVNEVTGRLAAGSPLYYAGPPTSGAPAPSAPPAPAPAPQFAVGGGLNIGSGGSAGAAIDGGAGAAAVARPPTPLTGAALDDYIRQTYGAIAWALDNPELGPILRQAASEGWDDGRLQAKIQSTTWWKTHSAAMREITALQATDPAEYARHIDTTAAGLRDRALQMGIPLSIERSREIAEKAVQLGWDDNETNDALAAEYHYDPKVGLRGDASAMATKFRQQSRTYGVPVDERLVGSWVEGIIRGSMTPEDVDNYFKTQAKSRFGFDSEFVKQIDAGVTTMDYYSPYLQQAARVLELNPAAVDLENPFVAAGLNRIDPATGKRGPMSLYDYDTYLRSTTAFRRTHQAKEVAADWAERLTQMFGETA